MIITLHRDVCGPDNTLGTIAINDRFECYCVEDTTRYQKLGGKTAIPAGRYQVVITMSPRVKKMLPLLLGVPGFTDVRIHHSDDNSPGCIVVGKERTRYGVAESRMAYEVLYRKIEAAMNSGEIVWIDAIAGDKS